MRGPVVVDSTCLITLDRISQVQLLPAQFDPVFIPPAVSREFGVSFPWLEVHEPAEQSAVSALKLRLDDGEAEAIVLAQDKQCRIILDDRKARLVARDLGLDLIGTIGILIRAKREGQCAAILPLLLELEANGFYISQALRTEALRIAEETP